MENFKSILLIFVFTVFFPYFVMGLGYGPSAKCIECSMFEQSFTATFPFLFLPVLMWYLVNIALKWNLYVFLIIAFIYIYFASFNLITRPFYIDRIAEWTTNDFTNLNLTVFYDSLMYYLFYFLLFSAGFIYINRGKMWFR